jgi:hypothetical protein
MIIKRIILPLLGVLAFVVISPGCSTPVTTTTATSSVPAVTYPATSGDFEIQGLTFRSIVYYYNEGIYESLYNEEDNRRFLDKAGNVGGNYLLIKAFYNCAEDGSLIGDNEAARLCLGEAITMSHGQGMKVFFSPYVEAREFWPEPRWTLSVEAWTEVVLMWARFAEENNVEIFAPGFEMGLIFDPEVAAGWFQSILPQIREVYSGWVAFAEVPWGEQWDYIDDADAFTGYDCVGITVFPWMDYDGSSDIRSFEEVAGFVEDRADRLDAIAAKYNCDCRFVAYLGMDFWYGEMPPPDIRAQGYAIMLDVFEEHGIDGVFLHLWASEHDHLGESLEVENMLQERWALAE